MARALLYFNGTVCRHADRSVVSPAWEKKDVPVQHVAAFTGVCPFPGSVINSISRPGFPGEALRVPRHPGAGDRAPGDPGQLTIAPDAGMEEA